MVTEKLLIEGGCLYLPLSVFFLLVFLGDISKKSWVIVLMASTWQLATLPIMNYICVQKGFWHFGVTSQEVLRLPVSLYLGWAALWGGVVPLLLILFQRKGWFCTHVVLLCSFALLDVVLMPLLDPVLILKEKWWWGEAWLLIFCLIPAQLITYAKTNDTWLRYRALFVSVSFILIVLVILPSLGGNNSLEQFVLRVTSGTIWENSAFLFFIFITALPGLSAVTEFVIRGGGTPIPYDPPETLVISGVYSYCANPMQVSMVLVSLVWGVGIGNEVCFYVSIFAVIYSLGIAHWSEGVDMKKRFGRCWDKYRLEVRPFQFRVLPFSSFLGARLYLSRDCGVCRELKEWFERNDLVNLDLLDAENFEGRVLTRITYQQGDYTVSGIRAVAEAFQHINIAYAILGWVIKLPIMYLILQKAFDHAGAHERACDVSK